MQFLFYTAVLGVFVLAFKPLKEAAAYRFKKTNLLLEGLSYVLLGLMAMFTGSWWPLLLAGVVAFVLYRRRSN